MGQAVRYGENNIRNYFICHVVALGKGFLSLEVTSCPEPTTWAEFKNFIQIISTNVLDKFIYIIYIYIYVFIYWSTLSLVGNQFINLNCFSDI